MHPARPARARRRRDRERGPLAPVWPPRDDGEAGLTFELYLARHGETEWSANGRHTGKTDLPLTPRGEERARALKARLAGIHFDAVLSSPMQRARKTAELAGFNSPHLTPLLQEFDYGQYEGLTSLQIHERNPSWDLYRDGCPGGETPEQVYARAQAAIALATGSGSTVIAFAHGHILRAIAAAFIRADITVAGSLMLDVATISRLLDDGHRLIGLWNSP